MSIQSKAPTGEYRDGWDRIFGKRLTVEDQRWIAEGNRQRDALFASGKAGSAQAIAARVLNGHFEAKAELENVVIEICQLRNLAGIPCNFRATPGCTLAEAREVLADAKRRIAAGECERCFVAPRAQPS